MKLNGDIMKTVSGLVLIVIALAMFPIVLDGTNTILSDANIADYTGLESIVEIAPLIILVGLLFSGGFFMYSGARSIRRRRSSASKYRY